ILTAIANLDSQNPATQQAAANAVVGVLGNGGAYAAYCLGVNPIVNSGAGAPVGRQMLQADALFVVGEARMAEIERMMPKLRIYFTANPGLRTTAAAALKNLPLAEWLALKREVVARIAINDSAAGAGVAADGALAILSRALGVAMARAGGAVAGAGEMLQADA